MTGRIRTALAALVLVIIGGTVGYMLIEGWTLLDAAYMTVITIGTVGFHEVAPLSDTARVFTMALIFAGVGALGFAFGTLVDFLVEGHLRGLLEGRRMQREIARLKGHAIVAGIGRVGLVVADAFRSAGVPFVVIDNCEDRCQAAEEAGWLFVRGDAADEEVLREAGIERAQSLVTALDTDADNLFVTLTARQLNPGLFIVTRSSSPAAEGKMRKSGADRVVTPNVIGGLRMASLVMHPAVQQYLDVITRGDEVEFRLEDMEVSAGSQLVGKRIKEARIRETTGTYILAVHSAAGEVNTNPPSVTVLHAGDRLVVLGTQAHLDALSRLL